MCWESASGDVGGSCSRIRPQEKLMQLYLMHRAAQGAAGEVPWLFQGCRNDAK